jgi:DegV family protein with EDD domain
MKFKIVSDSSSNIISFSGVEYTSVPLKVITARAEYVDDATLQMDAMLQDLRTTKEKTHTSCPNAFEWQEAFGDAECVFAVTITSQLSGSCAAAEKAKSDALAADPTRKIAVIDSLSTGPEMQLLIEKLREEILAGKEFEEIEKSVRDYAGHTHLLFSLQSLNNLARNGRVSPIVAKLAGILGIRMVAMASAEGTIQPLYKPRGKDKTLETLLDEMKRKGFAGGKVRIAHSCNPDGAEALSKMILTAFPNSDISILPTTALCTYYAEEGGLLVGFEGA